MSILIFNSPNLFYRWHYKKIHQHGITAQLSAQAACGQSTVSQRKQVARTWDLADELASKYCTIREHMLQHVWFCRIVSNFDKHHQQVPAVLCWFKSPASTANDGFTRRTMRRALQKTGVSNYMFLSSKQGTSQTQNTSKNYIKIISKFHILLETQLVNFSTSSEFSRKTEVSGPTPSVPSMRLGNQG